jgi:hypothetical protein
MQGKGRRSREEKPEQEPQQEAGESTDAAGEVWEGRTNRK